MRYEASHNSDRKNLLPIGNKFLSVGFYLSLISIWHIETPSLFANVEAAMQTKMEFFAASFATQYS